MPDIRSLLQYYSIYFQGLGLDAPRLSAELILAKSLQTNRLQVLADPKRLLTREETDCIATQMERRALGEPVAYILGYKEFYGLDFLVDRSVLIPRPETELIVDLVRRSFSLTRELVYADIGTGSGALGISIASLYTAGLGMGTDCSESALEIAARNAAKHGVQKRFFPVKANLGDCLQQGKLDLIVSNPPYLSFRQYKDLSREIKGFEPMEALIAGEKGTEKLEGLLGQIAASLKPKGFFFLEIDSSQGGYVHKLLQDDFKECFARVYLFRDLSGQDRVITAQRL